jgi:2-dehydropantoate 2-reductase
MSAAPQRVYILGVGAIGLALAVHLSRHGRQVTAVRTGAGAVRTGAGGAAQTATLSVRRGQEPAVTAEVEMRPLSALERPQGAIVVTAKAYANEAIAARLGELGAGGPVVVLQNGVGVEDAYLAIENAPVYRGVIYASAQKTGDTSGSFVPIAASPLGVVRGDPGELARLAALLDTPEFPFTTLENIQQEVWKKAAINAVFNSICPLLEADNGIFARNEPAARLARTVVDECIAVMHALGFPTGADEVMQQLFAISRRSDGQLISTLQDIHAGRRTEIDDLNLAIARAALSVSVDVPVTRLLGEMIQIKSNLGAKTPGV